MLSTIALNSNIEVVMLRQISARFVLGVRGWFTRRALAKLLLNLSGSDRRHNVFLSCQRTDGAGAQLLARLQIHALADYLGVRFVNLPITVLDHAKSDAEMAEWNELLELESIASIGFAKLRKITCSDLLRLRNSKVPSQPTVYVLDSVEPVVRAFPGFWFSFQPKAQSLVRPEQLGDGPSPSFCAHLRREPGVIGERSVRYTSNLNLVKYIATIRKAEAIYERPTIFTYSQDRELSQIVGDRAKIDYDSSALTVFGAMYRSRYLLIAKSALSYVAGYLSPTAKVYSQEFWLPKLPDWKFVDKL